MDELIARRRTRVGAGFFEALLTEFIRSRKEKVEKMSAELDAVEKDADVARDEYEVEIDQNLTLKDHKVKLTQRYIEKESDLNEEEDQSKIEYREGLELEDELEKVLEKKKSAEDQSRLIEAKLQQAIRVDLEAIADLTSSLKTATEDIEILNQCLDTKRQRRFQVLESSSNIHRLMKHSKEQHDLKMKDLIITKKKEQTLLEEKSAIAHKLNNKLNSIEVDISKAKANIEVLELDREADDRFDSENRLVEDLAGTVGELCNVNSKNYYQSDENYQLDSYHTSERKVGSGKKPAFIDRNQRNSLEFRSNDYNSERDLLASPLPLSSRRDAHSSMVELRMSNNDPVSNIARNKTALNDANTTRDFIHNSSYTSTGIDRRTIEDADVDQAGDMLQDMEDDLKVVRLKHDGMVSSLKNKIRLIEETLNCSAGY